MKIESRNADSVLITSKRRGPTILVEFTGGPTVTSAIALAAETASRLELAGITFSMEGSSPDRRASLMIIADTVPDLAHLAAGLEEMTRRPATLPLGRAS